MPHFTKDMAEVLRASEGIRLADIDPDSTPGFDGTKKDAAKVFDSHDVEIAELQDTMRACGALASVEEEITALARAKGSVMSALSIPI